MKLKAFYIAFAGLKQGKHQFQYEIDQSFFENFGFDEYNNTKVHVDVLLDKRSTLMDVTFHAKGVVNVNCDITNEPFDVSIESELDLVVKFGDEFNDEDEELLILPHGEYQFNVSQYIYEMIVLAVPVKRIHPGVEDGTLDSDILDKLNELSPKINNASTNNDTVDPRWAALKNFKTDN